MKKVLLTTIALSALLLGADCSAAPGNPGLTKACEEKCNGEGHRVDVQYSEETGKCQCSTDLRNT